MTVKCHKRFNDKLLNNLRFLIQLCFLTPTYLFLYLKDASGEEV